MYLSKTFYTILLTFYGAINSKLVASTDNSVNENKTLEHSVSEIHSEIAVVSDNICNNHEKNVADVVLIDSNFITGTSAGIHNKNINKRQASSDSRRNYKDRPREDQKSLLIIFDGTGSMQKDLDQLRSGAQEIINDLSSREDSPIFNYVLVVFRDPSVEQPFETRNPKELLQKLKEIHVTGGEDCPEMAISGLKLALKLALPNSFAYVFSDASSKDHYFYNDVESLIQKKQVTVNFLLTGNCNQQNQIGYKVYEKISRVSNGQVYDMNKNNVKDVLVAIRDTVKPNFAALKSVDVEHAGKSETNLNVDKSISQLKVSIAGQNPQLSIRNPSNVTVKASEELTLNNLKLVNIKDPMEGLWKIEASSNSAHSIRLSALSDLKVEFGFSLDEVVRKSETAFQPLLGHKNILTLFISDPSLISNLSNVKIILVPSDKSQSSKQFSIPLNKIRPDVYATKAFEVPIQMFKIQLNGNDVNGNAIERLISTGLVASGGSAPEVNIEASQREIYEGEYLQLKCMVKSHIPVDISWSFRDEILSKISSNQSNELELAIENVQHKNHGLYKCLAVNRISSITEEISINVLTLPKVRLIAPEVMRENFNYSLKCKIDDIKEQKITIKWYDENEKLLQDGGDVFNIAPTHKDDKKAIKCVAQNKDFTVKDSTILNIKYPPKFNNTLARSEFNLTYGSNFSFDCSTFENPKKESIQWSFTQKYSNETRMIENFNDSILKEKQFFEDHAGLYECLVKNEVGEARREFSLFLLPKAQPRVTTRNTTLTVNESDYVEIYCECKNCLPLANFSWMHDNEKEYEQFFMKYTEDDAFKTVMKLGNVDGTDNGTFQCSMWNLLGEETVSIELIVQTTPKIEGIIINSDENEFEIDERYELLEGRNFSVECIVDGFPEPKIQWMRNGEKISEEPLLNIESIQTEDEGDYECIAINKLGISRKNFSVNVNYPPRRKREIETSFEAIEDQNVTLTCDLIGNPNPNISWQINSRDVEPNEKYNIQHDLLSFLAKEGDSGVYRCVGANKFGQSAIDFSVVIMSPPKMLSPNDESLKLTVGTSLKLSCDATGYPKPLIYFAKDSEIISNDSFIEIESATAFDSGSYSCIAENQVGRIEKIFYVTVVSVPNIESTFENITIINDDFKEVICKAKGTPEPIINWMLNDNDIISLESKININSTFSSGKISCIAKNSEGSDVKSFYLEVIKVPILLSIADELSTNIEVKENSDIELFCPFENYDNITWTFNQNQLQNINHRILDQKLFIHSVSSNLNGNFTCTAATRAGVSDFSYKIEILSSPTIYPSWKLNEQSSEFLFTESDIDEKVLKKGEKLKLNCTASGSPQPKILWRKGSDLIAEGNVLSIDGLDFYHSDIYTCSAENSQGSVKKFFKVDVISAPYIDESIPVEKSFQKLPGDSAILKCSSIIANPAPLYFWFKDNEILDDEVDDHVIIDSLKVEDGGKYRCLAKNRFGSVKIEYEISIYESAKIIKLESKANEDDSLDLICAAQGNPLPIISWTLNGHILSTTSKLNVDKLLEKVNDNTIYFDGYGNGISFLDPFKLKSTKQKFFSKLTKVDSKTLSLDLKFKNKHSLHLNKFFCYSFNALGKDEKSIEVTIDQKPHLKSEDFPKVQELEILENMPLLLSCLIDGFPQPQITWFKNGMKIYENETIEFLKNKRFLRISEASAWNTGNYSCVGNNDLGKLELKFNVLILSPPKIRKLPEANHIQHDSNPSVNGSNENEEIIEVKKGSNVILECSIEASPKAKIHWVKLNFNDPLREKELLKMDENFLMLDAIEESCSLLCYANNTIGSVHKFFHINVQYPPVLVKNKDQHEEYITVKLHHSINFDCQTKASPDAVTYWSFNSTNLTESTNDYYFTSDRQIMRIMNANKNHEGKYVCSVANKIGRLQKVFYVKIEIPIQYSPWSEWSDCSASCGSQGLQYRSRTCVLLDSLPSYNCTGENVQMRKCNDIPCPVNGGWSEWTNFTKCPACYDARQASMPIQKRYRKCNNPAPSFGGLNCIGSDEEVRECKSLSPCRINGGWSNWTEWTQCSKTCGRGFRSRKRFCNNPPPKYDGKSCDGENYEYEDCKIRACSNSGLVKSMTTNMFNDINESTEQYNPRYGNGNTRSFKYAQRPKTEYSLPPHPPQRHRGYNVKVSLDTYKPISEETYSNLVSDKRTEDDDLDDYFETDSYESAEAPKITEKNCGKGFKYNRVYNQCEEVDECKSVYLNSCRSNERCINTIGSYRCERIF